MTEYNLSSIHLTNQRSSSLEFLLTLSLGTQNLYSYYYLVGTFYILRKNNQKYHLQTIT